MSSSNNRERAPKRRTANSVISLTKFAHAKSKGTRKAIENYKQKKQSKFNRNAGLLREYRKAMKNEGYDAGKGGSRKRSLYDGDEEGEEKKVKKDEEFDEEDKDDRRKKKRRHKADPLAKAKEMAKRSKEEREQKKESRAKEIKENEKRMKQKKIRSRKLSQRTNRGQPIMKNVVGDLLHKIRNSTE